MIINLANFGGGSGGGSGVTNYNQLENKPQINAVTLTGNTSLDTLDIAKKSDVESGDLMSGLARQIYSPTGTLTDGSFVKRTTAGNLSVSTGLAQLRKIGANTVAQEPVYDGFGSNVTDGHLTASFSGTVASGYTGGTYTYDGSAWSPALPTGITTTGTAINGDVITITCGNGIIETNFTNPQLTVDCNYTGTDNWSKIKRGAEPLNSSSGIYVYNDPSSYVHSRYGGTDMLAELGIVFSDVSLFANGNYLIIGNTITGVTVTEASRVGHITVAIDKATFQSENPESSSYNFSYNGTIWSEDLATNGISITGTPLIGDVITVTSMQKDYGELASADPIDFSSIGINMFGPGMAEEGKTIDGNGDIVAQAGSYLITIAAPIILDDGYVAYSSTSAITRVAISSGSTTTGLNITACTQDSELSILYPTTAECQMYIATTDIEHLCVHPRWSGYNDRVLEDYWIDTIDIPQVDISGNTLPEFIAVGSTRNEYDFEHAKYIKRVESITATEEIIQQYRYSKVWGTDYVFDEDHIYQVLDTPVVFDLESISYNYRCDDFGFEQFTETTNIPVYISSLYYMDNLVDKLRRDVATKDDLANIKTDKVEAVATLPTTGVSAGTLYNYDNQLYRYTTASGYCGEWFGYTNLNSANGDDVNISSCYHYHLLDDMPTADYHLATFSYFTYNYMFVVLDKTSKTLKIYSGSTSNIGDATLSHIIQRNAAATNVNIGGIQISVEWRDNHIYFKGFGSYIYNRTINNPTIEGAHYVLANGLNDGDMSMGGYGIPTFDYKGNVYKVDNSIKRMTVQINKPAGSYNYAYYYGRYGYTGLPDFFAPTVAGTSGQILKSNGGGAPTWDNIATLIGGVTFWVGTQDQYDALGTYSDTVAYLIKED